jgi:hypothetical protein
MFAERIRRMAAHYVGGTRRSRSFRRRVGEHIKKIADPFKRLNAVNEV